MCRPLAFAAVAVFLARPQPACGQEAEHVLGDVAKAAVLLLPMLLLPSAIGPEVAFEGNRDGRLLLGWPFQVPLTRSGSLPHRAVAAVEVALGAANGANWRGRAGYRYAGRALMAGAGAGADGDAWFVLPEVGLRIPEYRSNRAFQLGVLLALRADIPPSEPDSPRVSLTIGWILF